MTSPEQMRRDAIDAYPLMKQNPNLVFVSGDGATLYVLIKGAVVCIQAKNDQNFHDMDVEQIAFEIRMSFPDDF